MSQNYYIHGKDPRSQETIEKEKILIENLCAQNEILFQSLVEQELKKEIKMFQNEVLQMELNGGRYLNYTDRTYYIKEEDKSNNIPIIMTVHGIPGSVNDFFKLQSNLQSRLSCRWINFLTPGIDGKDERRGTYKGYLEDTALLMNDFLNQLNIDKVILVMHSAGGLFGKQFVYTHPERIKATVQLASIGLEMWKPIIYQNQLFSQMGIDVNKISRKEIEAEEFRKSFFENINQIIKSFENTKDRKLQVWKILTSFDHIMLLKAQVQYQNGEGFDKLFLNMKNIDRRIPRFFAYSGIDILLDATHIHQEIHHAILSPQSFQFQLLKQSQFSHDTFQLRDKDHVLKNFIFCYKDAGHSFQHHKGIDISIKLSVFIKMIDEIYPIKNSSYEKEIKPCL